MTTQTPSTPVATVAERLVGDYTPESKRLGAVVLMAGSVRQTELARAAQRALLDLPVAQGRTLGGCWLDRVSALRAAFGRADLPLIVAANGLAGTPREAATWAGTRVCMDSEAARGSGGALRDAVRDLPDDRYVLIAPGHAFPSGELAPLVEALWRTEADVAIHADASSVPSGFFLMRCGVLAGVASNGFADLKEQVLPQLSARTDVRVIRTDHAVPVAVRSLEGYIKALRAACGSGSTELPLEEWRCTFNLSEPGAQVHQSARLHDSVVLAGGRVGAGALVVRSLVGQGGVVSPGEAVFDRIVSGEKA